MMASLCGVALIVNILGRDLNNSMSAQYTVPVKELENGDQFIELPDELINQLNWKEGDDIEWREIENGFELKKKELN